MTWTVDQPCEVEVTKGKWVAAIVVMGGITPRVKTLGGKLVRPQLDEIREPKAASSLRHAVPPPSSEVAEAASHERVTLEGMLAGAGIDTVVSKALLPGQFAFVETTPSAVTKQVARVDELRRVPKPAKPWRSTKHLAHVRALPCCVCGAGPQSEAHHVGPHPMGRKVSDAQTAPLCGIDHTEFHLTGRHGDTSRETTMKYQWCGVRDAARTALSAAGVGMDEMEALRAAAAEAEAMVWVKALEGRDAAEESET